MKKLLVITGQTATGKTTLAAFYAKKVNGELVNADSRQIYKLLDIVPGKDRKHLKKTKIWLYDIADPKKPFSSYDFTQHAIKAIKKIHQNKKVPILVGGTYFYLKHLLYGVETPHEADWKLRKKLNNKSVSELQSLLKSYDPNALVKMNQSDRANPRRLIRKIEIFRSSPAESSLKPLFGEFDVEFVGLRLKNKKELEKKIRERVRKRLKEGALKEVKNLLHKGYSEKDYGLQAIGYKELISHVKGELSLREAVEKWITKELQYAKRQYAFMKKDKNIKWKTLNPS